MATYYVYSGAGGANNGSDWTNAFTTFAAAVTAATAAGDVIKVHKTHTESMAANATYTFGNHVAVIVVDKDNSDAVAIMDGTTGYIANSWTTIFNGAYKVFISGLVVLSSGSGGGGIIAIGTSDGSHFELENFKLQLTATSSSGYIHFGYEGAYRNGYVKLKNCTLKNASTSFSLKVYTELEMEGGVIDFVSGSTLFNTFSLGMSETKLTGVDLSSAAITIMPDMTSVARTVSMYGCKLHASTILLATQSVQNMGSGQVFMYDCASGDTHYKFAHYCALGSTVVSTSIYANDNPTYDGTNKCSWVVASTAYATFYTPYVSPWISKYHDQTSAITPYLEVLRDGSATAYQDNEVWVEFSYQGTSGSPLSKFSNDRMTLLGSAANQTASSKGASDWTGESGTNWYGKLDSGSAITPAEIGHLRARVCIGAANATLYVDPQIRTA